MAESHPHRYKELRLGQLRAFCECVRCKSFKAGARALQVSQPTVWQQVRALERDLGATLVHRHGNELAPTEDGLILLELAASVLQNVDSLKETFAKNTSQVPRRLRVFASASAVAEELAQPLINFVKEFPQVKLCLIGYTVSRILSLVTSGDVDLALLPIHRGEALGPDFVYDSLYIRPASLVVPEGHPLATKPRLTLGDIVRYPLILPGPDMFWRFRLDEVFRNAGLLNRVQVLLEQTYSHAARRYVSRGFGVALMPMPPRDPIEFPGTCIRPVGHLFPDEEMGVISRRGTPLLLQARLFCDFLRQAIGSDARPRRAGVNGRETGDKRNRLGTLRPSTP